MADQSKVSLPTTYNGLLDDAMARFSDKYRSAAFFNRMLAKNLFFGGGVYINDGYLLNHRAARRYLVQENSLLRVMIRMGFVKILTRFKGPQGLAELPEKMAAQGIRSFQELRASPEWDVFQPKWVKLADSLYGGRRRTRMWPDRDMSYGLTKLMVRVLDAEPHAVGLRGVPTEVWRDVRKSFLARKPREGRPRDKFEKAAEKALDDHSLSDARRRRMLASMMNLANQAYHYNFGFGLTYEDGTGVAVDTTIGMAFDEFLKLSKSVDARVLKKVRLFGVPNKITFDDGRVFEDFVKRGTDIWRAKRNYIAALGAAMESNSEVDFKDLNDRVATASEEYAKVISQDRSLQVRPRDFRGAPDDKTVFVATGATNAMDEPIADAIGAQHGALAVAIQKTAGRKGVEFLAKRGVLSTRSPAMRLNEIVPQVTSLAFNRDKVTDFLSDIPPSPFK